MQLEETNIAPKTTAFHRMAGRSPKQASEDEHGLQTDLLPLIELRLRGPAEEAAHVCKDQNYFVYRI